MLPKIIIHNTITLDGAYTDFAADLDLHYTIAASFEAQAYVVGSNTLKSAVIKIPTEKKSDFRKPLFNMDDPRPYWVIADSRGQLNGILHSYRRMSFMKDIIVMVSEKTPKKYLQYLEERDYDIIYAGKDHVDLSDAFQALRKNYGVKKLITDTGGMLDCVLLNQGLADEINLLIAPEINGSNKIKLFDFIAENSRIELKLLNVYRHKNGFSQLHYKIIKK
ncbi:MAG TPA: dihydrofolate reductase family protein [Bacteroidales bacterium]|nr:dihydrofolate reductase family protein [Bacteroidales bacterium]HPS17210.1 dihydrofolate reductase family protein [Bacteroidales bacterium]